MLSKKLIIRYLFLIAFTSLLRGRLKEKLKRKIIESLKNKKITVLQFPTLSIKNLNHIILKRIQIQVKQSIEFKIELLEIKFDLNLISKKIVSQLNLHIDEICVTILGDTKNKKVFSRNEIDDTSVLLLQVKKYFTLFFNIKKELFKKFPASIFLVNSKIVYEVYHGKSVIEILSFSYKKNEFIGILKILSDNYISEEIIINCIKNKEKKDSNFRLLVKSNNYFTVPFINTIYNCLINLKQLIFIIKASETKKDNHLFTTSIVLPECQIFNIYISDKLMKFPEIKFIIKGNITEEALFLDKESRLTIAPLGVELNFLIHLQHSFFRSIIYLNLRINSLKFIEAYPKLERSNIKFGRFLIKSKFELDLNKSPQHNFKLKIKQSDFDINSCRNLIFECHKIDKHVHLKDISKIFIKTILSTEDPRFYNHHGIDEKLLGYSIISDLQKRKFFKGGSTITMQLVRNIFLSDKKNIERKLIEAILASIIENENILSKNEILETYLNVIEFGIGVYGIEQGSDYYFSKQPLSLNLLDSLVLSYIIPRPKYFLEALNGNSLQLKNNLKKHIESFSRILERKGIINEEEVKQIYNPIVFSKQIGRQLQLF